jgi:hypothetical protein
MEALIEQAKNLIRGRQFSYQQVFGRENKFAEAVLKDLAKFCYADSTSFHADPRIHALAEGRREVWLRIMQHLNMTPEEYFEKFRRKE